MNPTKENIQSKVESFTTKVGVIQDRLRVKSNLFSLEARQVVEELSEYLDRLRKEMHDLEFKAKDLGERVGLQTRLGFMETEDKWNELRKHLDQFVSQVNEVKDQSQEAFDYTKVHAHLAAMDAKDAVEEKIAGWRKKIAKNKDQGSQEISNTLDKMLGSLKTLLFKFDQ